MCEQEEEYQVNKMFSVFVLCVLVAGFIGFLIGVLVTIAVT